MKQMAPWDLTCRPPETHVLSPRPVAGANQPQVLSVSRSPQTATFSRCHLNYRQNNPITNFNGPTQLQLVMREAPTSAAPDQNFIWNSLNSNKQLQALLATATQAASLNSNHRIDLAQPLNWLQAPTKSDQAQQLPPLPLQSPVVDFNGNTIADNKHHLMTILSPKSSSSNYEHAAIAAATAVAVSVTYTDHQSCTPLSLSSSPVSSTSSYRSSTESINLTLNKAKPKPKFGPVINVDVPNNFQHRNVFQDAAVSSPSGVSSDAEFLCSGEVSSASNGLADSRMDRRARKKDQNRRAAFNYRRKKMEERDRMLEEEARLVHRHVRLAGQIAKLEKKILLILNTKTARILNKDGKIVYYSCPICLKHCSEDIETLRNHLKAQHLQRDKFSGSMEATGSSSDPYETSGLGRGRTKLRELEYYEDFEYDSCIESDETNNFGKTDLYNDCDDKFVNRANLDGDDYNNIKNNLCP